MLYLLLHDIAGILLDHGCAALIRLPFQGTGKIAVQTPCRHPARGLDDNPLCGGPARPGNAKRPAPQPHLLSLRPAPFAPTS